MAAWHGEISPDPQPDLRLACGVLGNIAGSVLLRLLALAPGDLGSHVVENPRWRRILVKKHRDT